MRGIDFTQPGGFPLTQDEMDHLQQAYTECINALSAMGGDSTTPVIISGMEKTIPSAGSVNVTDGWFFYNGEMIRFTGSTVTPTGTDQPVILITTSSTSLTYYDGSTHPAVYNKTATLISGTSLVTTTRFPYANMLPFQVGFGLLGRESTWNTLGVSTSPANGSVTGTIYYKKNNITNTLHIRASLTANQAQNFAASPFALFTNVGTLPSAYIPTTTAYFTAYYYAANLFADDLGVSWVKQITSSVNTGGQIMFNFLKPDSAIVAYTVMFNTIIPLD